ncbi:MAG: binding-protein-dependent transport system inner rane component [Paenibacillaceae bacterium]|nr:binding-protein-dependent transport system inner rane component [Paenibacillaceae bacterium]
MQSHAQVGATGKGLKARTQFALLKELSKNRVLFLMLVPAVVFTIIFSYIPLTGLVMAFKKYNYADGFFFSPWNGLDNFRFFFISGKAWIVTRNTLVYNLVFILSGTFVEVLCAILIAEMRGKYFKKASQSLMFLPFFVSWVIVATFIYNIFNYEYGIMNSLLTSVGLDRIDVYSKSWAWMIILPLCSIWKGVGYGTIVYLAAIMGISKEMYEAAEIDGANKFKRIWHITIPQLTPTIVIMLLLAVGRILRGNFEMFYQLIGSSANLFDATDIIDTFVFRSMTAGSDFGMISAASFYQSILCFIIIVTVNQIVKMVQKDYALF